jgi:hypothetical protein
VILRVLPKFLQAFILAEVLNKKMGLIIPTL